MKMKPTYSPTIQWRSLFVLNSNIGHMGKTIFPNTLKDQNARGKIYWL